MWVLRHARRDRPEPGLALGRLRDEQDASDAAIAVKHVVVVGRPLAVWAAYRSAFEGQQGLSPSPMGLARNGKPATIFGVLGSWE
jgi:hypothetical protein